MVQFIPAKDDWADAFRQLGSGVVQGYTNRSDENAVQKAIMDLGPNPSARQILDAVTNTKTYSPAAKQRALSNYLGVAHFEELKRKAQAQEEIGNEKNRIAGLGKQNPEERAKSFENFKSRGYTDGEAEAMTSPYVTDGTKQVISRHVEDEIARNIRQPQIQQQTTQGSQQQQQEPTTQPVDQNAVQVQEKPLTVEEAEKPVLATAEKVEAPAPEEETKWPALPEPKNLKPNEMAKWRTDNEKFNRTQLKELRSKNQANQDALLHYSRLTQLNDTGKVQNGLSRALIDPETGEPYKNVQKIAGVNKETQLYIKTLNDFISQAKNFFGARVTNFDLQSFKSRLPSLLNTEEGRRAILEQMRLMTELQALHDSELSEGIKQNGDKGYIDIVKTTDDRVTKREESIINKINHIDVATKWLDKMAITPKYKDTQLMFNPETDQFVAVKPGSIEGAKKKGYELWRSQF